GAGAANRVQQRRAPILDRRDQSIGRHPVARRHQRSRLGCSQATDFTPSPDAISWPLKSSSEVRGSSQVWYLTVTSSDCEISRGSNTIWLRAKTFSTCVVGNWRPAARISTDITRVFCDDM